VCTVVVIDTSLYSL